MKESIYDEDFKKIKALKWLPWVGPKYPELEAENRILIVGESYYLPDKQAGEDDKFYKTMTRDVIQNRAIHECPSKPVFLANTHNLILGSNNLTSDKKRSFWNRVVFYNFIQRQMDTKKHRPEHSDFETGWHSFFELVHLLKPSTCVFLGVGAETSLHQEVKKSKFKIVKFSHNGTIINRCYGKHAVLKNSQNQILEIIFIRHPSAFFSASLWRKYLTKTIPNQIEWIKNVIN